MIFITAGGTSDTAIEAMKLGAYDYLLKPLDLARVRQLVGQALEIRRLMHVPVSVADRRRRRPRRPAHRPQPADAGGLQGHRPRGPAGRDRADPRRKRHRQGAGRPGHLPAQHRAGGPFLAVNCAAIPETLLESELFGHEKGPSPAPTSKRIGKFEQCNGGTLFLDEIGDMTPLMQSKLLRVLQEQQFERVGGNETIQTDVRIIAATNRDLEQMVADGQFPRRPLLPPQRLHHQAAAAARADRATSPCWSSISSPASTASWARTIQTIARPALELLMHYPWPGNVRELQSVLKQAMVQATGPVLLPDSCRRWSACRTPPAKTPLTTDLPPGDLEALRRPAAGGRLGQSLRRGPGGDGEVSA